MYSRNTFREICNFPDQIHKSKFLEIFSHENILSWGIIDLTNFKRSYAQKHRKRYLIFAFSARYFYTIRSNNVSEQKLSNYIIKSILNWLDLISTFKKMANSDNRWRRFHFLSCLQFAKVKGWLCLKIALKFLEICSKYVFVWV